jgi:hypothetical protein
MAEELKKRVRDAMRKIDAKDWDSLNQMQRCRRAKFSAIQAAQLNRCVPQPSRRLPWRGAQRSALRALRSETAK